MARPRGQGPRHRRLRRRARDRDPGRRGDKVAREQPLVTLESDKATMDVPAPFAGKVAELEVSVGDEVSEGSVLMMVEASAGGRRGAERTRNEPAEHGSEPPRTTKPDGSRARRNRDRNGRIGDPMRPDTRESSRWRAGLCESRRAADRAGDGHRPRRGDGHRAEGADHEGGCEGGQGAPAPLRRPRAPRSRGSTSRPGRRSTSRSTARSSGCRCPGSRRSAARTSPATG